MLIAVPPGDHVLIHGRSQGFKGLPVHHEDRPYADKDGKTDGTFIHILRTAWTPTPDELARLNAGANIIMEQWGDLPMPTTMMVGLAPE